MTELKAIASSFDLTVGQLAKKMGYSKQGLYQAFQCTNGTCSPRMISALSLLQYESSDMLNRDINNAKGKNELREKGIQQIADSCGIIWNKTSDIEQVE